MGKVIAIIILASLCFISLDIFARFLFENKWYENIKLAQEVDAFNIISLIFNGFIAIGVGWFISKKLTEQRFEKEFLIKDLLNIEGEVEKIEHKIQANSVELDQLIFSLSKIENYHKRFKITALAIGKENLNLKNLKEPYSNLYKILTNCDGDSLIINQELNIEISELVNSYLKNLRAQIIYVNKR